MENNGEEGVGQTSARHKSRVALPSCTPSHKFWRDDLEAKYLAEGPGEEEEEEGEVEAQ